MSSPQIVLFVGILATLASVAGSFAATYYLRRKDKREDHDQTNKDIELMAEVKNQTIAGLVEQNALLKQQIEEDRARHNRDHEEWKRREEKLEGRIDGFEIRLEARDEQYSQLVLTITKMGLCVDAAGCENYNPGDRRTSPSKAEPI